MPLVSCSANKKQSDNNPKSLELRIKKATWDEMKHVAGFIKSSAEWYREIVDPKDMKEHQVGDEWIKKNYPRRDFYIGYEGDTPVGTISMQNLKGYAYLGYIYLDVDFVGRGFGHQLMDFAKEKSINKKYKGMVLIAHPEAKWAIKAYKKYGFRRIARSREDVLKWNDGVLKTYYEEGFELYEYGL